MQDFSSTVLTGPGTAIDVGAVPSPGPLKTKSSGQSSAGTRTAALFVH